MAEELVMNSQPDKQLSRDSWAELTQSNDNAIYCRAWLRLLCEKIDIAASAVVVIAQQEQYHPVAQWPDDVKDIEKLADIVDEAIAEKSGLLASLNHSSKNATENIRHYALAYPVQIQGNIAAVTAIEIVTNDENKLQDLMQQLQWGSAWLEALLYRQKQQDDNNLQQQLESSVDLLAAVLNEKEYTAASMALATEMAHRLNSDRVSVGFWEKNKIQITAISHTADFTKRMNLIRFLSQAMEEAIEQRFAINFSLSKRHSNVIILAHDELSRQHGAGNILTIPLYHQDAYYAAVTFERPVETPFTEEEVKYVQAVLGLAGVALNEKRLNDKPVYKKLFASVRLQWAKLVGPQYAGRKLAASIILTLILFFTFAKGIYRINADVTIEGELRRVISAPFNGYISQSVKRAGDIVKQQDIIAKLDDRELRLERIKWASQFAQYQRQHQEALAKRNRAQVNILSAQIQQAKAQLNLAESRLKRTHIVAPFDGLIVTGDLSQRLGAAIQQGEVLFELTPLDNYRVILQVDEHRISEIKVGQRGPLVLSALPEEEYYFQIEKILPTTTSQDGENRFRVEARLESPSKRLQPGMQGVGKVEVEQRRLISIWTQALREWVDLQTWKWFGF